MEKEGICLMHFMTSAVDQTLEKSIIACRIKMERQRPPTKYLRNVLCRWGERWPRYQREWVVDETQSSTQTHTQMQTHTHQMFITLVDQCTNNKTSPDYGLYKVYSTENASCNYAPNTMLSHPGVTFISHQFSITLSPGVLKRENNCELKGTVEQSMLIEERCPVSNQVLLGWS